MKTVLLVGPWVGEFGWELMAWQGWLRAITERKKFHRIIVLNTPGKESMYALPNSVYEDIVLPEVSGDASCYGRLFNKGEDAAAFYTWCRDKIQEVKEKAENEDATHVEILMPNYQNPYWCPTFWPYQKFISYRVKSATIYSKPTVAFVIRKRSFCSERNLDQSWWDSLASLLTKGGVEVLECPHTFEEARWVLSSVDLAIGGSTGGIHLASLCECPIYVWGVPFSIYGPWEISDKQRHEIAWNPLGAPLIETLNNVEGWKPKVDKVYGRVMFALEDIGRRAANLEKNKKLWQFKVWLPGRLRLMLGQFLFEVQNRKNRRLGSKLLEIIAPSKIERQ